MTSGRSSGPGDALQRLSAALLTQHPLWNKRTLLLLRMDAAPVKLLRGKSRYQVLFKLFVQGRNRRLPEPPSPPSPSTPCENTDTWLEVNPANMM